MDSSNIELYLIHFQDHSDPLFYENHDITIPKFPFLGDPFIKKHSLDLIHFNHLYNVFYLPFSKTKKIATIHGDIEWIDSKLDYKPYFSPIKRILKYLSVNLYDAFIAVSYDLRNRVSKYYNIELPKIYVTHLAARDIFGVSSTNDIEQVKKKYGLKKPFIFHVSFFSWKKNPLILFKTLNILLKRGFDIDLVIAGKGWNKQEKLNELLNKYRLRDNVTFLDFIPMEDLVSLYGAAEAYFQPSFHENCPQTVLEAMSCGAPVITSNVFSIPEITGDAGILKDPTDVLGYVKSIEKILSDKTHRENIIIKTLNNAKKYTLEKTFEKTIDIYEHVLANSTAHE